MLLQCPICGPRDEDEFAYGGDASIIRPKNPEALSDSEWADFVYFRDNPKGRHREFWFHRFGCRCWLTVERDTVTHSIGTVVLSAEPHKDNTR
jgi:heterotetrameric sarcosine oxidase delta subunit